MLLPNGDRAIVDPAKLWDYCLSSDHPRGKHKARLFAAALGWSRDDWPLLQSALLHAARTGEAKPTRVDGYGSVYEVVSKMVGATHTAAVLSVWIIEPSDDFPRLVTCYPL